MKVLEDNRAQVSERVKALSQRLEEEKAAAVGAPRHLDEEVIALNKVRWAGGPLLGTHVLDSLFKGRGLRTDMSPCLP